MPTGTWTTTGSLNTPTVGCGRVKLANGDVLVIGGQDNSGHRLALTQLYNHTTQTWSTVGSMAETDFAGNYILLNDGTVLKAGGNPSNQDGSTNCELYNPGTQTWSATGSLSTPHWYAPIFLLNDGTVLLAGGSTTGGAGTTVCEIYNPTTHTWSVTGALSEVSRTRFFGMLGDGRPIVVSGVESPNRTSTFSGGVWTNQVDCPFQGQALENNCSVSLPNGNFLILCPLLLSGIAPADNHSYLYNYIGNTWSIVSAPAVPHMGEAYLLQDGTVLLAGGEPDGTTGSDTALCDIYDPSSDTWSSAGSLPLSGVLAATGSEVKGVVLNDGTALWVGQFRFAGPFAATTALVFTESISLTLMLNDFVFEVEDVALANSSSALQDAVLLNDWLSIDNTSASPFGD